MVISANQMIASPFLQLSVLIVDQDSFAARLMNQVLLSFEFEHIYLATSLEVAIEIISTKKVDIILCDWLVNEENGLVFVEFVRRNPECKSTNIPIVLYTGYTEVSRIILARDAGVSEVLAKPIAPHQVLKKIDIALFTERKFVKGDGYIGPDRRRKSNKFKGEDRRGEFGLEQDQIDDVMNRKS
jgi:CheY-like chemotaxis protein